MSQFIQRMRIYRRNFERWYNRHFLAYDTVLVSIALVSYVLWVYLAGGADVMTELLSGNRAQLYSAVVGALASLLGFVLTAKTIAIQSMTNDKFRSVTSKDRDGLWETFNQTLLFLGIGSLLALVCLVVDRDAASASSLVSVRTWFHVLVVLLAISIARIARAIQLISMIARIVGSPQPV